MPAMADWRQIQARIRKAKNSPDAPTKLHELYQRTRDAMVAWELGAVEEKAERTDEAVKWYTIAVERFRRADWKKKAEEALTRLGAPLPEPGAKPSAEPVFVPREAKAEVSADVDDEKNIEHADEIETAGVRLALGEIADDEADDAEGESEGETASARRKAARQAEKATPTRRSAAADVAVGADAGGKALQQRRDCRPNRLRNLERRKLQRQDLPRHPTDRHNRHDRSNRNIRLVGNDLPVHGRKMCGLAAEETNHTGEPARRSVLGKKPSHGCKLNCRNRCCLRSAPRTDARAIRRWLRGWPNLIPCCGGWFPALCISWTIPIRLPPDPEFFYFRIRIKSRRTTWKPARPTRRAGEFGARFRPQHDQGAAPGPAGYR